MKCRHFGSSSGGSDGSFTGLDIDSKISITGELSPRSPMSVGSVPRKANLTSYKVFAEFFKVPIPGSDSKYEERILTRECYQRWLSTRKGKLLHPEGSFRRTVLAHLRGADGRKPFPAHVEVSLLKKLRERDSCDRLLNPWTVCFETDESNLEQGCRKRFTALGYHEGVAKKSKKTAPVSRTPTYSVHTLSRRVKPRFEDPVNRYSEMVNLDSANFKHKMHVAKMHDVDVCLPAISFMLDNFAQEDARMTRDFVFPPPHECRFEQNLSLFELDVNGVDWIVNSCDINAEYVLGNVSGMHLSKIFPSLVEFFNIARLGKEMTQTNQFNNDMWIRARCIGLYGQVYSILACFKLTPNPTSIHVVCQDQTMLGREADRSHASLNLPPLLV